MRILGFILVIAGALALAYGGFTYTKDRHAANIGPISIAVEEKGRVNVPVWLGLGAVVAGTVLLVAGGRRRPY
jgi:hypothetical protein